MPTQSAAFKEHAHELSSFKKEECKQMHTCESAQSLGNEQPSIADMIAEVATSKSGVTLYSAAALRQVCRDVITGEGTTVVGRVHFSRTIDDYDAVPCALIYSSRVRAGAPVSRAEADAMFDIGAMAGDRRDRDRFDDLLVKAVVHHVMAASSYDVPGREIALAPLTSVKGGHYLSRSTQRSDPGLKRRDMGRGGAAARTRPCEKALGPRASSRNW